MKKSFALMAALAFVSSGWAIAAQPSQPAELLQKLDTDKDGYISKQEALGSPGVERNFAAWDKDKDGKLSRSEVETGLAGPAGPVGPAGQPGGMTK
jgi:hypothetical protein